MRLVSNPNFSILLCLVLLLGVQSQSDITFHATETQNSGLTSSSHNRFLAYTISDSCYTSMCTVNRGSLINEDSLIYSLSLLAGSEITLDILVGDEKMAFSLELSSNPSLSTRTNIKIFPSDSWPYNAVPTVTGSSWTANLNIPFSSFSTRSLRVAIQNSSFLPMQTTFKITVTSRISSGTTLQPWAIIVIVVGAFLVVASLAICAIRSRRRRLARERTTRIQMSNQNSAGLHSHQQPQQIYNQDLQPLENAKPMHDQQPQAFMQPGQMYAQQQMYPQQMYVQQPQMYPQQQMYMQQPMYQQYPQQQMYQQQPPMVIQVGQPQ